MAKIKITVVKKFTPEEVFNGNVPEYYQNTLTPCPIFEVGQEFIVDNLECPEGFCHWAFTDIHKDIVTIHFNNDDDWYGMTPNWVTCTDGKRPVVFQIEKMEDTP
jgi:uncharacterized repeat protein (TIGR04076 family)